jgi:hypothetical protein
MAIMIIASIKPGSNVSRRIGAPSKSEIWKKED